MSVFRIEQLRPKPTRTAAKNNLSYPRQVEPAGTLTEDHLESVSGVFLEQRIDICDPLRDVIDRHFSHFVGNVERDLGLT